MTSQPDPPPLTQLVLKIHSRCDLLCDHCYVYQHADQSWRTRPTFIRPETVRAVAERLADYAAARRPESVAVILHGGEPLLVGPARLREICAQLTRTLSPVTRLDLHMHTNAVTLARRHLDVCAEFGVRVSVSLDGDRAANDRHRVDRRGRSSYDRAVRGVRLLQEPEYRHLFGGLLCTVDAANDPVAVHDALTALDPPAIDYLLPHSTWDSPPPNPSGASTPYADWLLAVFDRWDRQGRRVPVRTFDSVLSTLRGGPSLTEALGLAPSDLAVIETDGAFELADWLKSAYPGAPETGCNVTDHAFEEFAAHPGVRARQRGAEGVSDTCRRCPVLRSCGGGLYGHRYGSAHGFDAPSVFCRDLRALIEGIADRVTDHSLAPAVLDTAQLRLAQLELDRVLLRRLHETLSAEPDWANAWRLLLALDADPDTAPHLDATLTHPYVRTALHRSRRGPADTARFMALAVAAALRAGVDVTLAWNQPGARLHLPTWGTVRLDAPGRVEVAVAGGALRVSGPGGTESVHPDETPASRRWRPLTRLWATDGPLVDDADPYRDCFDSRAEPPLETGEFAERVMRGYELMDKWRPEWRTDPDAFRATALTPLRPGGGLQLGAHGLGAVGVPVDVEPDLFARELPRLGRRARLTALRETADLHRLVSPAGALLERADEALGEGAADEAAHALTALTLLPEGELTPTGAVLAVRLWDQWGRSRG